MTTNFKNVRYIPITSDAYNINLSESDPELIVIHVLEDVATASVYLPSKSLSGKVFKIKILAKSDSTSNPFIATFYFDRYPKSSPTYTSAGISAYLTFVFIEHLGWIPPQGSTVAGSDGFESSISIGPTKETGRKSITIGTVARTGTANSNNLERNICITQKSDSYPGIGGIGAINIASSGAGYNDNKAAICINASACGGDNIMIQGGYASGSDFSPHNGGINIGYNSVFANVDHSGTFVGYLTFSNSKGPYSCGIGTGAFAPYGAATGYYSGASTGNYVAWAGVYAGFQAFGNNKNACAVLGYNSVPQRTNETCRSVDLASTTLASWSFIHYYKTVTGSTPTEITIQDIANARLTLLNNSAFTFRALVTARNDTDNICANWVLTGVIKRAASAATTALVGTVTKTLISNDAWGTPWDVNLTADTTNGALAVTVTGETGKTIKWVCNIQLTEARF